MDKLLTPLNHRETEFNAKRLSGCDIPDSFLYGSDEAKALLDWLCKTSDKVFDDDLVMDYGTDCLRLYLLFENTPKEKDAPFYESWNEGALEGMYKFLGRYRRLILASFAWNRQGGYCDISKESLQKMQKALENTKLKIEKSIKRPNTMPNRHHVVSALMELLNLLQKELKTGEIMTEIRQHAVETASPAAQFAAEHTNDFEAVVGDNTRNEERSVNDNLQNEAVTQICREFIILMAPIACDLSKILWMELSFSFSRS